MVDKMVLRTIVVFNLIGMTEGNKLSAVEPRRRVTKHMHAHKNSIHMHVGNEAQIPTRYQTSSHASRSADQRFLNKKTTSVCVYFLYLSHEIQNHF